MYLENLNMFKMRQYSQFKFKSNFEKRLFLVSVPRAIPRKMGTSSQKTLFRPEPT